MSATLAADSVGKAFGGRKVLQSAFLDAHAGQITAVLGRNGAGKSTLLRIAAGRIAPDHGTVLYGGRRHAYPRLHRLAREGLFYLPEGQLLPGRCTVRECVEMFARRYGGEEQSLRAFELDSVLDRTPDKLSGGERRRAELALAWIRKPKCLVADEPLRGVAPKDAESLLAGFRELARRGCALVVSGHEVENLLGLADRVVWVTSGTTQLLGSAEQARADDRFRKEYLVGHWGDV